MIDLSREICKQVLKLDFTAHGIMESLSEFGLSNSTYLVQISSRQMIPIKGTVTDKSINF
jgi:hypothetical protein